MESSSWLLDYEPADEPAVEVVDYWFNHGADLVRQRRRDLCGINEISIALPTAFFDAIFNVLHQKAIDIFYPIQCNMNPHVFLPVINTL